eukprot:2500463-Alexandrium_andersonii.AAC.1
MSASERSSRAWAAARSQSSHSACASSRCLSASSASRGEISWRLPSSSRYSPQSASELRHPGLG